MCTACLHCWSQALVSIPSGNQGIIASNPITRSFLPQPKGWLALGGETEAERG